MHIVVPRGRRPVSPLTFGYAIRDARATTQNAMTELAAFVGDLAERELQPVALESYDELTQRLNRGELDLAWVPPVPLISLARAGRVVPLVTIHRDQLVHYRSTVIVASSAPATKLEELAHLRAAWVDPHSAAGYVLARIELARRGIGSSALGVETFFGSHDAVVRAVATNRADFGATFARLDREGAATGPWIDGGLGDSVRVLATFGEIPPDAIAARAGLGDTSSLTAALFASLGDEAGRELMKRAIGADALRAFEGTLYETFRDAVSRAYEDGVLNASAALRAISSDADATTQHATIVPDAPTTLPDIPNDDE